MNDAWIIETADNARLRRESEDTRRDYFLACWREAELELPRAWDRLKRDVKAAIEMFVAGSGCKVYYSERFDGEICISTAKSQRDISLTVKLVKERRQIECSGREELDKVPRWLAIKVDVGLVTFDTISGRLFEHDIVEAILKPLFE